MKLWTKITLGLGLVWSVVRFCWGLLGDWQQVNQAIADWPDFVRWLGAPQTGPIIFVVAVVIYLVARFWPSPAVDPLVDKFFHTYNDQGQLQYQGRVLREVGGRYVIQLYSAWDGEPTDQRLLTAKELETARFYETREKWLDAHEQQMRRLR